DRERTFASPGIPSQVQSAARYEDVVGAAPNLDMPTDSCPQANLISGSDGRSPRDGIGRLRESRQRFVHVGGALCAVVLSVLAAAGLLAGCDSSEVARPMMPAPIIMKDPRLDFTRLVAPENRTTDVRVLYATTRAPAAEGAPGHYLQSRTSVARLGIARVQLGKPGWSFADLVESDRTSSIDVLRPARVISIEPFGDMGTRAADRAFVAAIDRQVEASRTGEAVIYIPGYRVTFNQVITLMGAWA